MPIPIPRKGEPKDKFFSRCMGNGVMVGEFPDAKIRGGVCKTAFDKKRKNEMICNIRNIITNFNIRTEEKEGINFLIIPIVALVEGVHAGSGGTGFYPSAEIDRTAQNWNGVPLTIDHPKDNGGAPITANNPDTLKKYSVGTFENVRYEKGKLKGEGWIDKNRIELLSPEALEMLSLGRKMEVSTGLFTGSDGMPGIWNGEPFEETLTGFIPDHLALLPNAEGACNFDAGCGVRVNKEFGCGRCLTREGGEANVKDEKIVVMERTEIELPSNLFTSLKQVGFWVNEISHSKIREQLFKVVSDMDKQGTAHFLREVFDKSFVFEKVANNESKLFKVGYKLKDDEVSLKGTPEEVKEKVEFLTINEESNMERTEAVDALIANESLPYVEEDREVLTNMADESFERTFTLNDCKCQEDGEALVKANTRVEELETKIGEMEESSKVDETREEEVKEVTFEALLEQASPELRESIEAGIKTNKEKKDNAVQIILEAEGNRFSEEELQAMPFDTLENIISMTPVKVNYAGNGSKVEKAKQKKLNERQDDGSGVPDIPQEKWNKDGTPDFSHLSA